MLYPRSISEVLVYPRPTKTQHTLPLIQVPHPLTPSPPRHPLINRNPPHLNRLRSATAPHVPASFMLLAWHLNPKPENRNPKPETHRCRRRLWCSPGTCRWQSCMILNPSISATPPSPIASASRQRPVLSRSVVMFSRGLRAGGLWVWMCWGVGVWGVGCVA